MQKNTLDKLIDISVSWNWTAFGFTLLFNKLNNFGKYSFYIDIQIGWFNVWIQFWRKPITNEEWLRRKRSAF
jgi:hypothetical protein